jgi:signal transduction histidine kinase
MITYCKSGSEAIHAVSGGDSSGSGDVDTGRTNTSGCQSGREASGGTQPDAKPCSAEPPAREASAAEPRAREPCGPEPCGPESSGAETCGPEARGPEPSEPESRGPEAGYDPNEVKRARAVIRLNLYCVLAWIVINCAAAFWLGNPRPAGVAAAGAGMAVTWSLVLRHISRGRMTPGDVATYTVSGLLLLLVMGLFVPELSLLFTFATFIFLAFGLSYLGGRASMQVVALTLAVALVLLLLSSVAFRWSSGVPDDLYRWINLVGLLMALAIDAIMFVMLRRTLEARAQGLVEAEREAAQMQRRISQQERLESIGKLAGGVAHDFNNLLGIILSYTGFIAEAAQDQPELLRDVEEVQAAAKRAAALTRQLLIFGRRDLTSAELVDLNQVIRDSEGLLRSTVGDHIEFRTRLAKEEAMWVRMDAARLEQVLLNLSVNARDAMPDGGSLLIETSQRWFGDGDEDEAVPRPGRYACLSVTDTGTGFTEEARQHAFEPFFTTKPAGSGTGLGLATIYGIAADAGGDITLFSEPGTGTTVRVYLPVSDATVPPPVRLTGARRAL